MNKDIIEGIIEHNIPIPNRYGTLNYPIANMKIGDSIIIATRGCITYWEKKYSFEFTARKIEGDKFRMWRIK